MTALFLANLWDDFVVFRSLIFFWKEARVSSNLVDGARASIESTWPFLLIFVGKAFGCFYIA